MKQTPDRLSAKRPADRRPRVRRGPHPWPRAALSEKWCLPDLEADTLSAFFDGPLGTMLGWDAPHIYHLDGDRYLWLFNDAFFDPGEPAERLTETLYTPNAGMLQDGTCMQLIGSRRGMWPEEFEPGWASPSIVDRPTRFLWPLGGTTVGRTLYVYWAEIDNGLADPGDGNGIWRLPVRTWIATYDTTTLERTSWGPAPDSGIDPLYGFGVVDDGTYTYLFGNAYLLRLDVRGGWANGPHPSTQTFLARVPSSRQLARPQYWNGSGWSRQREDAAPISDRWWVANLMQPILIDGRWYSVAKEDEFWGDDLVVDVAERPWGPWTTVATLPMPLDDQGVFSVTYHPIILPWLSEDGDLLVVVSRNAADWSTAVDNPSLYRPFVMEVDVPDEP